MEISAGHTFKHPKARVIAGFRDPARVQSVLEALGAALKLTSAAPRPTWKGTIRWRGIARSFDVTMTETVPGDTMVLEVTADIAVAHVVFRFLDTPDGKCRVTAEATATPKTTMARLAIASLVIVKRKLANRLSRMIQALGRP